MLKQRSSLKWLNVGLLGAQLLSSANNIVKTRYFTANVSGRLDANAPARQNAYLAALKTSNNLEIHYGNFLVKPKWAGLVQPDLNPTIPNVKPPFQPWPDVVRIWKTEEKGSDVNLAVHLLNDAFLNAFDVAAVITNDTDLTEALRIVRGMGKVIGLLTPVAKPATSLVNTSSFCHHIRDQHLAACQFPDPVRLPSGRAVAKPTSWA